MEYLDYDKLEDYFLNYEDYANRDDGNAFEWFVYALNKKVKPRNVLFPLAADCEVSYSYRSGFENADYVVVEDKDQVDLAKKLFGDFNDLSDIPSKGCYDLIAVDLINAEHTFKTTEKSRLVPQQLIERCVDILSDNGYFVLTFTKSFVMSTKWVEYLASKCLYCNAVIDMPAGSYYSYVSADTIIVVLTKTKTDSLFLALLSDLSCADTIVDNFVNKKQSNGSTKLGVYVSDIICSYDDFARRCRVKKKQDALKKAYNGELVKISDIGAIHSPSFVYGIWDTKRTYTFDEHENSVYIPKLGSSDVVTDVSEFNISTQNYFQVVVENEKILPQYLAFFLNTEEGKEIRQLSYHGSIVKALNKEILSNMMIPCPDIKSQMEYLGTFEQLEKLRMDVENLQNKFLKTPASYKNIRRDIKDVNNTGDKFLQWIESLPYPLATILKRYSVSDEPARKQEILFYFFEAYSIFNATLMSAALNKKIVNAEALSDINPDFFERSSFGNWVKMDRALSNLFLKLINSPEDEEKKKALNCFRTYDDSLIRLLCNRNICNILDGVSKNRNAWKGHTGITSEEIYEQHALELEKQLRKLQESIKDLYEKVRLIRPLSLDYSNEVFENKVEVLTGSNSIFGKVTIKSVIPLDKAKLYLQVIDTDEVLELPPYFILKNSPAEAKNACYFYSSVDHGNTRYVSYHFDGKPEEMETGERAFECIKDMLAV